MEGILGRKEGRKEEGFRRAAWGQDGLIGRRLGRCMWCGFAWSGRFVRVVVRCVVVVVVVYQAFRSSNANVGDESGRVPFRCRAQGKYLHVTGPMGTGEKKGKKCIVSYQP